MLDCGSAADLAGELPKSNRPSHDAVLTDDKNLRNF